jgi:hypothetical protein
LVLTRVAQAALRKWLKDTDLNAHLGDKEVRILLTSLKERIDTLRSAPPAAPTAAGGSASVVNEQELVCRPFSLASV